MSFLNFNALYLVLSERLRRSWKQVSNYLPSSYTTLNTFEQPETLNFGLQSFLQCEIQAAVPFLVSSSLANSFLVSSFLVSNVRTSLNQGRIQTKVEGGATWRGGDKNTIESERAEGAGKLLERSLRKFSGFSTE